MYIKRIYLKNIRGFSELNLDLALKKSNNKASFLRPRMRTVIIGKNGTCKTTLLRCLAIGLTDKGDLPGFLTEDIGRLVAEGKRIGTIEITLASEEKDCEPICIKTSIGNEGGKDFVKDQEGHDPICEQMLVCGYGIGRSTEGPESGRPYRIIDSAYSLFNYDQSLIGVELTLRRLRDYLGTKRYAETMQGIKKALGLGSKDKIYLPKGGGVLISGPEIGKEISLWGWADGYRMTFHWLVDLYAWGMRAKAITRLGGIKGIVLIDELEQHCHPSMQTDMLNRLSKLLPDLQIITSTHSPLVTLGAMPSEVVVLKRKGKKVYVGTEAPDFRGYSAEDVLLDSKLFESDVYSPETNKKLASYRELVSIPAKERNATQKKKLASLTAELASQEILEDKENPTDRKLRGLIKKYGF